MAENLMCSEHKTTNDRFRKRYERVNWEKPKKTKSTNHTKEVQNYLERRAETAGLTYFQKIVLDSIKNGAKIGFA